MRRYVAVLAVLVVLAACSHTGSGDPPAQGATTTVATGGPPAATTSPPATTVGGACLPSTAAAAPAGGETLVAVQAVGPDQAWALGNGLIVHTGNGGRTWERQYGGAANLLSVDMIDARHGWAVGAGATGLLATDDGACWKALAAPPTPPLRSVHFVDTQVGWGVAAPDEQSPTALPQRGGVLVKSTDGGRTWMRQSGDGLGADVQATCFTDASMGWVTAGGKLAYTNDGGAHWRNVPLPDVHPGDWAVADVQCAPGGVWALGLGSGGALSHFPHGLYRVPNGGPATLVLREPYTAGTKSVDGTPGSYPGPLSVVSADAAALVGFTPPAVLGRSTTLAVVGPGGIEHPDATVPAPDLYEAKGASFVSAQRGWVVGDARPGYAISATSDGGRSWATQFRTA